MNEYNVSYTFIHFYTKFLQNLFRHKESKVMKIKYDFWKTFNIFSD